MRSEESSEESHASKRSMLRGLVQSTFVIAAAGGIVFWISMPGTARLLGLPAESTGWLGWVAPAPWVWLTLRPEVFTRGRYLQVWLAGCVTWMLTLYWVTLPHPLTPIGWPFLAGYLGVYLMLFVLATRRILRRTPAPVWVVAPVVWAGLELVQAHLFTGILIAPLSHSQAYYPVVIQMSDLTGGYGVSFVLVMVAAVVVFAMRREVCVVQRTASVLLVSLVVAGMMYYGSTRLAETANPLPGPTVALVQGAEKATWDWDPDRQQRIMETQETLTRRAADVAAQSNQQVDLYVWPESMFRAGLLTVSDRITPTHQLPEAYQKANAVNRGWLQGLAQEHNAAFLVGLDRFDINAKAADEKPTLYNTAAMADKSGKLVGYYDKTHRVPFGEYIPLAKNMPALYYLTPMSGGLGQGDGPVALELETQVGKLRFAPSICYESVIPHVIRRHVAQLTSAGQSPDVLVNVTNDAWFWGTAELDLHLACGVFRAVENRLPMVIAANTGLSAVIDSGGRVLHVSQRMQEDVIVAQAPLDRRGSFYAQNGDWFALACIIGSIVLCVVRLPRTSCPT